MADDSPVPAHVRAQWRRLARSLAVAFAILGLLFLSLFVYARTWPPLVVIAGNSMQHGNASSSLGAMDVGDVVLVQAVTSPADLVTYVQGRATGYSTYGDYGDVVVIRDLEDPEGSRVVHRALMLVTWNVTACAACYDVPELNLLSDSEWDAWNATGNATGTPTDEPFGLTRFVLRGAGWTRDQVIDFSMWRIQVRISGAGLLTMGDNNVFTYPATKFDLWIVPLSEVVGKARGEIPWFGLIGLTLSPNEEGCCESWGSTDSRRGASENSWRSLEVSLLVLLAAGSTGVFLPRYLRRGLGPHAGKQRKGGLMRGTGAEDPRSATADRRGRN
ncbi:MAG: hypothetical protein ACT4OI_05550 [Methanobacteriota archaeon]